MAEEIYSKEQINDWQTQLKDFAKTPRTRFSKKQAVYAMIDEVEAALESHPYDQVAEKLRESGFDIAAGSLKQYVNAYRREHGSTTKKSSSKRRSSSKVIATKKTTKKPAAKSKTVGK
jgi:hypothetical protein